ncbi:MAG: acyl-CoA thioesterase [Verrucomicrobia bacterium]|nr:acyl-CoA thioesterase [Verrucomicrobiota bacterium]
MPFEYKIRTRYAEGGLEGIIHHSSFVIYLEEARVAYLKKIGCDINELKRKKVLCPIIDLCVKYIKQLQSLEDITIQVWVESFSKMRFELFYQILKEGTIVAKASTSECFLDEQFKPIPLNADFLETLKKCQTKEKPCL